MEDSIQTLQLGESIGPVRLIFSPSLTLSASRFSLVTVESCVNLLYTRRIREKGGHQPEGEYNHGKRARTNRISNC